MKPPRAEIRVREVGPDDEAAWVWLRCLLWPDGAEDHAPEVRAFFEGKAREPQVVFVAEVGGELVGFAEISLRNYADGCDSSPVGYLEGWFVEERFRGRGVGRRLVAAGEEWARAQGCAEFASDTELENEGSAAAHLALGFEEVGVVRLFRKGL